MPLQPRRRSALPAPSPSTGGVSLWNILRNNIGKDLSKVAMPVQLNEPLNTLQRLCEELEYSELLDTANQTKDPYQRMVSSNTHTHLQTRTQRESHSLCVFDAGLCGNVCSVCLRVEFLQSGE